MSADGDLILVGGAASTPLAGIALGYTGDRFRTKGHELNYRPLIRLPYFTQYDSRRLGNDYVGWLIDDKGVRTHNWTIVAAQDKSEFYRPRTHLRETIPVTVDVASVETRLLQEDYLLVTHLPNYVNPLFAEIVKKWDVPEWPRLTIFGGAHGLGTMAVELLMGKEGLTALERFEEAVGGAVAYQAIFRVGDIERDGGFHRANSVEFVKAASLPLSQVTESHYLSAHNRAMNLMFPERARQRSR
jgi:hypothetical protein